jgi:hypothetical protein
MKTSLISLLLLIASTAHAADLGWVSGTIKGADGKPAISVLVTVLGTGRSALTDLDGKFAVTDVPVGAQKLEIRPRDREPIVLPLPVNAGENAVGLIALEPEMPVTTKDPGFVGWKRVGANRAVAYRMGADCAAAANDTLPATIVRADSVIAAGHLTLALDPVDPSHLSFAFTPKGIAGPLSIGVFDTKGHVIRHLRSGPAPLASALTWDGRDDAGRQVPAGAYRARFTTVKEAVEFPFCRREVALRDSAGAK